MPSLGTHLHGDPSHECSLGENCPHPADRFWPHDVKELCDTCRVAVWLGPPDGYGTHPDQCPECNMADLERKGGKRVCPCCGFVEPCCQP